MKYQNLATSKHPALIIFLIDVSRSMETKMPNGKMRIDVVREVLSQTIQEMVHRSLANGKIKSRYRVGLFAYSEKMWDVWEGVRTIDEIENEIPELPLQTATDMAMDIRGVSQIVEQDIKGWSSTWQEKCPAPLITHITDAEYTEDFENPSPIGKKLMGLSVPDGNVLLSNILISKYINIPQGVHVSQWSGFYPEGTTKDRFGDTLLAMTSTIPDPYLKAISKVGMNIKSGARMLFPGVNTEFIKGGFAMSGLSSEVVPPSRPVADEPRMPRE